MRAHGVINPGHLSQGTATCIRTKHEGVFYGFRWLDSFSDGLDLICLLIPLRFAAHQSLKINPDIVPVILTIAKRNNFYSETNLRYNIKYFVFFSLFLTFQRILYKYTYSFGVQNFEHILDNKEQNEILPFYYLQTDVTMTWILSAHIKFCVNA